MSMDATGLPKAFIGPNRLCIVKLLRVRTLCVFDPEAIQVLNEMMGRYVSTAALLVNAFAVSLA
jgi:hypothetical protein